MDYDPESEAVAIAMCLEWYGFKIYAVGSVFAWPGCCRGDWMRVGAVFAPHP